MKRVLLTGSTGFIGRVLKGRLNEQGCDVIELNTSVGDIGDISVFARLDIQSVDHIFHLAARTFVPDSWTDPHSFYNTNVGGTLNILEQCRIYGKSLTFLSSYLYGEPEKLPVGEEDTIKPANPYAHSKYLAEQLCEFYSAQYGVAVSVIRPFNVYGIGQEGKFLIPSIIKQAICEKTINVRDLTPKRDYVYVDDLVRAIIISRQSTGSYSIYNIGSGCSYSVRQVIDMVQSILHIDKPVICEDCVRKNEISDVVADITRANTELGWFPRYSLQDGLKQIIDYESRCINERQECAD